MAVKHSVVILPKPRGVVVAKVVPVSSYGGAVDRNHPVLTQSQSFTLGGVHTPVVTPRTPAKPKPISKTAAAAAAKAAAAKKAAALASAHKAASAKAKAVSTASSLAAAHAGSRTDVLNRAIATLNHEIAVNKKAGRTSDVTKEQSRLKLYSAELASIKGVAAKVGAGAGAGGSAGGAAGAIGAISSAVTGGTLTDRVVKLAEYAAIILFLIWAWRKGYISKVVKRAGKLGQNSGDKIAKLGKGSKR